MDQAIDIKALREQLGWDQTQMAEYLGLDRSSVSRMENGQEPKGPVLKLLQQLNQDAVGSALPKSMGPPKTIGTHSQ
jgi:transcriptional regulator with XRE-family HTH domain